jgi:plastocyanin
MMTERLFRSCFIFTMVGLATLLSVTSDAETSKNVAEEQRIEIIVREYQFLLSQPTPIHLHMPTVVIIRNQDIVRHGFTSQMLVNMLVHAEGEGILSYGKGIEGFYVDPGKTLVIRFTTERTGNYSFRCDLHPQMKGELYMLEIPAA